MKQGNAPSKWGNQWLNSVTWGKFAILLILIALLAAITGCATPLIDKDTEKFISENCKAGCLIIPYDELRKMQQQRNVI